MTGEPASAGPRSALRWWEIAAVLAAAILFVGIRLPLLSDQGAVRGWNSDAGVFGLSARRIAEHGRVDVFFWGQNYMGPLTSIAGAAVALVRHGFDRRASVDPVSLRLGTMAEVFLGMLFFWAGLRPAAGRRGAAAALLLLAAGPRYLFDSSVIARGDEIAFVCSGVLFWLSARSLAGWRRPSLFDGAAGCLFFGLASGFGWWMNQGVVFILLPLAIVLTLRSRLWSIVRPILRPLDRLLVRPERLGWSPIPPAVLLALRVWHVLLGAVFLLAALRQAGAAVPTIYASHPFLEPISLLLATAVVSDALGKGQLVRRALAATLLSESAKVLPRWAAFGAGFLVGYLPVAAGGPLGWYTPSYGRQGFDVGIDGIVPHLIYVARTDLWTFLGADRSLPGILFLAGCAAGLLRFAWMRRNRVRALATLSAEPFGAGALAGTVLAVAFAFYAVALRNGGDPRFIVPALPAAYALAAAGLAGEMTLRRASRARARAVGSVAFALLLGCGVLSLGRLATRRVSRITAESDPRVLIAEIRSRGYGLCYAGFWQAYKLQFLSGETLRFIPWKSYDRNPAESRRLAAEPGRRCLLLPDGTFREFEPADLPKPIGIGKR